MTRQQMIRVALYAGALGAAGGVTWLATRGGSDTDAAAGGHNHGAAPSAATAQPVTLEPEAARRIGVTYTTAALGPIEKEIRTVGQVTFDETRIATISPKVEGWVERLYVDATGQAIAVGQPLLTIYSPMLVQAQEELLLARRLVDDMAGGGEDARRSASDLAASARRRLEYWGIAPSEIAAVERTGTVRRTLTLRSSAGGHVLEKAVFPGQRIMAGDALYKVADLRTVWVEGEVFEQDLAGMRLGQTVHADFQALPDEHRMGRISYIYPTVDPETRTARVRVALPNADLRLKPGMYATLRIEGAPAARVVTVPRDAVLSTGDRHIVFVREASGRLVPREVAIGTSGGTRVEVRRGLQAGETIVASATFLIDAESNLGKALGGMGDMPGMDVGTPPAPLPMQGGSAIPPGKPPAPPGGGSPHEGH